VILLVLLIIAGLAGVAYYLHERNYESTDDAMIDNHFVQISPRVSGQVVTVKVEDNQAVKAGDLLCEIDPRDFQARLNQAQGSLDAAIANEQAAKTNVSLMQTTASSDYDVASAGVEIAKAAIDSAAAAVDAAKSRFEQAKAQLTSAIATSEQFKADIEAAKAEATRADADMVRYTQLKETGSATTQQLDNAAAAARTAHAKLDSADKKSAAGEAQIQEAKAAVATAGRAVEQAQAQHKQAQSNLAEAEAKQRQANVAPQRVDVSKSQHAVAGADIEQLKASVELAKLQLEYTRIFAPVSGKVTRKAVEQGAYVSTGQAIMAIVPKDAWVVADFKETQLTYMKKGDPVIVSIDAYPDLKLKAKVDSIQMGSGARFSLLPPENATGNFVKVVQRVPVKIVFDTPLSEDPATKDLPIGPGMSVEPRVRIQRQ
jgi:membrane fusion protein (multidrug efflux system)